MICLCDISDISRDIYNIPSLILVLYLGMYVQYYQARGVTECKTAYQVSGTIIHRNRELGV